MSKLNQKIYTTNSISYGGRDGQTKSLDSNLSIKLSTPKELGGAGGEGANPEQLFACGYSSCFLNAVKFILFQEKEEFDEENSSTQAEVSIGKTNQGFGLEVKLIVNLPNLEQNRAEEVVKKAHATCPYSNAVRGNVDVEIEVRGKNA